MMKEALGPRGSVCLIHLGCWLMWLRIGSQWPTRKPLLGRSVLSLFFLRLVVATLRVKPVPCRIPGIFLGVLTLPSSSSLGLSLPKGHRL